MPNALRNRRELWLSALLFVGVFLVYGRVYWHDFINYDDPAYITENVIVQKGLTKEGLAWAFGRMHGEHTYWHPLTWVSHMLDCHLFGLKAGWHHLVSVLFHAVNAALVFVLFRSLTGAMWPSWMLAALFAFHPLQVDSVAWATERKNVLSTMFGLLTLLAYARYVRGEISADSRRRLHRWSWYSLALVLFGLGLMSKPALMPLPGVMLLLDFWPLNRLRAEHVWQAVLDKLPFFALAAADSFMVIQGHAGMGVTQSFHGLPLWLRIENGIVSYARYVQKTIWPSNLAVLYPHPGKWPEPIVIVSALLLVAITFFAIWNLRRRPYFAVGWFWFLGVLFPAIGILQFGVQAMADRFAYVPLIGLFLMFCWGGAELLHRSRNAQRLLSIVALAACVVLTSRQLRHWKDSNALFKHTLRVTTNNFVIHNNLGYTLAHAGRVDEAIHHYWEAVRIKPDYVEAHYQLGLLYESRKQFDEAARHYAKVVQIRPDWTDVMKQLGDSLLQAGKTTEAIAAYRKLLSLAASADVHSALALALASASQPRDAIAHYGEALRLKPDASDVLNNLAWMLATQPDAQLRNGPEAVRLAERACELTQRTQPRLIGTLAAAYAEIGRFADAVKAAEEAARAADATGDKSLAAKNRELLALYADGKPYRDMP